MTPQSVGLSGSTLSIGKLSGRRGLQGKLRELGPRGRRRGARRGLPRGDRPRGREEGRHRRGPDRARRAAPRRRPAVDRARWAGTSARPAAATRWACASLVVAGEAKAAHATGNGPGERAVRRGRRGRPADPRLAPGAHRVRDQGRVRGRGRAGPGARALPPVARRGPGRARGHGPRAVARTSSRRRSRPTSSRPTSSTGPRSTGSRSRSSAGARPKSFRDGRRGGLRYRIALIPGDGVGPEVVAGAVGVLEATGTAFGFGFDWTELLVGGIGIDTYGVAIRPEDIETCREADAVLLGACGGPQVGQPRRQRPAGAGAVRAPQRPRPVREPAADHRPAGADRRLAAQAGAPRGRRLPDRPRAHVGPLLRSAVRAAGHRRGPGRDRHPLVHGGRDPAHRRARVRAGARPPEQGDPGRQGERPRDLAPVAQGDRGGPRRLPRRRARPPPGGLRARCSSRRRRPRSTCS